MTGIHGGRSLAVSPREPEGREALVRFVAQIVGKESESTCTWATAGRRDSAAREPPFSDGVAEENGSIDLVAAMAGRMPGPWPFTAVGAKPAIGAGGTDAGETLEAWCGTGAAPIAIPACAEKALAGFGRARPWGCMRGCCCCKCMVWAPPILT